ncbi:MAG TPA: PepSY domain-containing protein [Paenalcaligenes hominis]|uniref:PepSY domain-containing protein n=1 Tax=Paenalcaligenes hominis TaxID=643674 RepID=A0A9D2VER6_9BURK|nr:PepSY domain-containing protein [Paenalcaligenes hominis]
MLKPKLMLPLCAFATSATLFLGSVHAQPVFPLDSVLVAASATADAPATATRPALPDRSEWITLKAAYEALEKAGYTDIRSIRSSRHHGYVARALDKDQKPVQLRIHPTDASIHVLEDKHKKGGKHKHRKPHDA